MELLLIVPVLLFSVVVHEVAHAWQALREGDTTARDLGRITLNPLPHLDPVGSLLVPLLLYFLPGDFLFGWAKPVPVNPRNYRNYRAGDIRVSLAGIVSNLCLVVLFALMIATLTALQGTPFFSGPIGANIALMATYGVFINLILAYFNLIPIPPLDGSHVLYHLLPPAAGARYREMGRYGVTLLFLTVVLFPGAFGTLLSPVFVAFSWIVGMVTG
ncbi:MAG: site-2 protease family protein [Gemmatimonadetes bacterium]|nr:site-2 protease family protein [Gemmatimonadota bacterium]MYA63244.1 site-2 protease family protein [Gemmatimonadota bacterium]MYC00076.1 site-2 protease family protein [Gemmatimonadota bacterium]MYH54320.1 site-2 protease family protein [Gemmatimonadota bacterium]MYI45320.1 site-2 protease family protein [Gemmatimonadota bacterium]